MNLYSTSSFSWGRKNWLRLWVNDIYIRDYPFTYTVEEALEDFCEYRGQIFKGIFSMSHGATDRMQGIYISGDGHEG